MAKSITRKTNIFLMIGESAVNLLALLLGVASVGMAIASLAQVTEEITEDETALKRLLGLYDPTTAALITLLFFLALGAARLARGFRLREKKGEGFFRLSIAQAAVFAACGALPLILGYGDISTAIASAASALALIAGRIFSIVRDHRFRNILPNALAIPGICLCAIEFILMGALLFLLTVYALMAIVFSRISFSVLKKIVVRTHAAEIVFGLVLLIVTFAMLLTFFEPNMPDFKDALWYCFAIVTTIGFGDLTAVTDFGRVLSVILGAYGIIVVALITSIIVNFYGEMKASPEAESGDVQEVPENGNGEN